MEKNQRKCKKKIKCSVYNSYLLFINQFYCLNRVFLSNSFNDAFEFEDPSVGDAKRTVRIISQANGGGRQVRGVERA